MARFSCMGVSRMAMIKPSSVFSFLVRAATARMSSTVFNVMVMSIEDKSAASWSLLRGFGASEDTLVGFGGIVKSGLPALLRPRQASLTNTFKLLPHVPSLFLVRTPVRSKKVLSFTRPCRAFCSPRRSCGPLLCDLAVRLSTVLSVLWQESGRPFGPKLLMPLLALLSERR